MILRLRNDSRRLVFEKLGERRGQYRYARADEPRTPEDDPFFF